MSVAAPAGDSPAPLTIALPKGRTLRPVAVLLGQAGVSGEGRPLVDLLTDDSRALVRKGCFATHAVHFLLLKPDDVPTYVEFGTADFGVCGRDVLVERAADVYHPVDLGIGRCRLVVAGPSAAGDLHAESMPRVATKYPRTAAAHFAKRGIQVEVVNVQGSVELAPITGLADLIVDLVETGTTLSENGLEIKEEIANVSTLLVANRASYKLRGGVMGALVASLRGVVPSPVP